MHLKTKLAIGLGVLFILTLREIPACAQGVTAALSGTVTDSSGKMVPNAKVTALNASTGQSTDTQTDASGKYFLPNLTLGLYKVSVSAEGIGSGSAEAALSPPISQQLDISVASPPAEPPEGSSTSGTDAPLAAAPPENLPNAPSSQSTPSLGDLGFSPAETEANAREQALLDKRSHMLKIHQRMGLITAIPLAATVITSMNAGGRDTSSASRDLHVALGSLTGDLYGITAYYAIRAPRVPGTETRGPIRVHKILAWIHGPGMIATPILGAMAFNQKNNGEKVHGIASAHGPVAIITAGAYGAALLSVSVKF
ncbi:MAG: carboxypeptidase regulatory-like domain-containing protein [Terriglobales bacterium]